MRVRARQLVLRRLPEQRARRKHSVRQRGARVPVRQRDLFLRRWPGWSAGLELLRRCPARRRSESFRRCRRRRTERRRQRELSSERTDQQFAVHLRLTGDRMHLRERPVSLFRRRMEMLSTGAER